jgi:uncharacterized protein YndB with AHSA1/START domain
MKWVWIILGVLVGLVAVVWIIGALLPKSHVATRMARYNQPPEKIWEAITDVEGMKAWRSELKAVERLPDKNGKPAWVEDMGNVGKMPLEVEVLEPPRRLITRIASTKLPFGGTWTFEIAPAEGGATLRITETGEVYPAFFRFMSRFIFGYTSTIETYLKDLGRKFGEDVTPVK